MKKRLAALLLVLALLLTCVPVGVVAEGTDPAQPLTEGQEETTHAAVEETTGEAVVREAHDHKEDAHKCEHCNQFVTWTAWGDDADEKTTLPNGKGHFVLVADIDVGSHVTTTDKADIVLCLNGYTVNGGNSKYFYRVGSKSNDTSSLTISDCNHEAGQLINGYHGDTSGAIYVRYNARFYMYAGKFVNNTNEQDSTLTGYSGGAIQVRNTAQAVLKNVEFTGNHTTAEGGAICIRDSGSVTLENVVLKDNTADRQGGAIFLDSANCQLTAKNCTFENNQATQSGGAIYIRGGTVSVENSSFTKNGAEVDGGAVYLTGANSSVTATDCRFEENTSTQRGGAIAMLEGSTATITGGAFHKNTATTLGGAIYTNKSDLTVQGTADAYLPLTENHGEANSNGGAVHAAGDCDVLLQYVSMTGNTVATTGGSALMVTGDAQVTLSDVIVTGNENKATGTFRGAVYVTGKLSALTLSGKVEIRDNKNADLYVQNNNYNRTNDDCWVTVDGMTEGSKVMLHTHTLVEEDANDYLNTRILDGQPAVWEKGWIVYSGNQMAVDYNKEADKFFFTVNTNHLHCDCGDGTDPHCNHTDNAYISWTDATSLPNSGTICLETDVKLPESVAVNGHLQICLNGHTISAEYEEQGSAKDRFFTLNNTDRLTISDCTAKTADGVYTAGKLTGSSYTGIMVAYSSTTDNTVVVDFYDGIFTGNESSAGAAFSIQDGATLNMYGGTITGNTSTNMGGAIYVGSNGTFNMYGGTITGNSAAKGAVYVVESTMKLYGGEITDNTVTGLGGGVYVSKSAMTLGGTPVILKNTAAGKASNLYLTGTSQITFDGMGQGQQKIGIGADKAPLYLSGDMGEATCEQYFVTDSQFRVLEVKDNRLYLNYTSDHGHCDCAGSDSHCDHQQVTWAPWESTTTLPAEEGYYYLLADVTVADHASFSAGHVHLCLNGYTVTAGGAENSRSDRFYTLQKDAKLTITDCTAKTENGVYTAGKLTGATGTAIMIPNQTADGAVNNVVVNLYEGILSGNTVTDTGGVINVQDQAVFNMYGGEVSGNTAKFAVSAEGKTTGGMGAAFYVGEAATLNIYEGAITGNTCEGSGTVYVTGGSAVNLQGGAITGNKALENAGGVMINGKDSILTVSGGEISNNTAKSAAGVLALVRGTLKVTGGTITGNTATGNGGGAFVSTNSFFEMTGGEISGNKAAGSGGGIALYGATAEISGGKIISNEAANGGGLAARLGERTVDGEKFTDVPTVVTMTGGEISGNKATSVGGGVFAHGEGTTFRLEGGIIASNESPNGGGVITQQKSAFTMKNGKISDNKAKNGAGLYSSYTSILTMEGGEISGNKATVNGGGVYSLGTTLELTGGKINGNYAEGSGAGIYGNQHILSAGTAREVQYTAQINLKGTVVDNNTTSGNGAGICTRKNAMVNMSSGSVSGNVSAKAGGGMLLQSGSKLNLTGGSVSNNRAKNGAGVYISTDSYINMSGGSIGYNTAAANGAGLYLLKCEAVLSGGNITGNATQTIGGGIYVMGSQLKLCGTNITDNTAKNNGAGICTTKRTVGGVNYYTNITMTGGTISGNKTEGSGGGVLLQSMTTMTMVDGIVENNHTVKDGAGIYVSTNCTFHMDGGQIRNNTAERNGGGLYNLKSTVNYNAGKITGNTAEGSGGGIVMSGEGYVGHMNKGMVITGNCSVNGGALVVQSRYTLNMEGVNLSDNTATTGNGGAIYLSTNSFLNVRGGEITNHSCEGYGGAIFSTTNSTLNMQGTTITGNKAGYGGAMSLGGTATLEKLTILDNEAVNEGGGIYCHKLKAGGLFEDHLITVKNSVIENNKAGTQGGGIYVLRGSECVFDGLTVQKNTAGAEGGGLYVVDDTALYNMTVTENISGGDGYALYLADSLYDGESYFVGIFKLGGVMIVKDNQGGDMYFGNQTAAAVDHMGLLEGTYMDITLFDGLLTQALQGVYHYEGGDQKYVVTAGDRSVTDPEYDPFWNDLFNPTEPEAPAQGDEAPDVVEKTTGNPMLWVAAGAAAVAVAAITVIIAAVAKKKKTAAGK